jgi:hypothetical protein
MEVIAPARMAEPPRAADDFRFERGLQRPVRVRQELAAEGREQLIATGTLDLPQPLRATIRPITPVPPSPLAA